MTFAFLSYAIPDLLLRKKVQMLKPTVSSRMHPGVYERKIDQVDVKVAQLMILSPASVVVCVAVFQAGVSAV